MLKSKPRALPSHKRSALVVGLALDGVAIALFVTLFVVLVSSDREAARDEGFFAEPVLAALALGAFAAALVAGVIAAASLLRVPLRTRAGRWAVRLAAVNVLIIPVVAVPVMTIAWIAGYELPEGWGEPISLIWQLTGVSALVLGVTAKEPGRRGVLVILVMIGAGVATFAVGEIVVPH
jgi:hypothetical protein